MNQSITPKKTNSTILTIIKWLLSIMFALISLGSFGQGQIGIGFMFLVLSFLLLPPISDYLKSNFKIWQSRGVRYISYFGIFFISSIFMTVSGVNSFSEKSANIKSENRIVDDVRNEEKSGDEKSTKVEGGKTELQSKKYKFKSCDFFGDSFYIIPDMKAADVYINFQERGFTVNKNIKNEGTDIYCELATPELKYVIVVTGCSPNKIISVEANTIDYSGNNLESVKSFLGFVATLQYKNSEPEKARKWLEENINKDGATTTIGGVTFSIHFKSKHSKSFAMRIDEEKLNEINTSPEGTVTLDGDMNVK